MRTQMIGAAMLCLLIQCTAMAQRQQAKSDRAADQKTFIAAQVSDFEVEWKSIDTHKLAILTIRGKDTNITHRFEDGNAPSFAPVEEGLKPGRYAYLIEYVDNHASEAASQLATANVDRRELLSLRKKLMEEGDRAGAKRLLKQANEVRQKIAQQPVQINQQTEPLEDSGVLVVKKGGRVAKFDFRTEHEETQKRYEKDRAAKPRLEEENSSL